MISQKDFLAKYRFSEERFKSTGLEWSALQSIYEAHCAEVEELQDTADFVMKALRRVPAVHSLRSRIKDPEHLIEKIIRKKLEKPEREITPESYRKHITDLAGIRALHLFKDEWQPIHEFVFNKWGLGEEPIGYYRQGDSEAFIESLKKVGCRVAPHQHGYRSVHYLLKTSGSKQVRLVELQVRTVIEEAWSEIDHQVRYPRLSEAALLTQLIAVFNRLAGSADEMGTFVKALSSHLGQQAEEQAVQDAKLDETVRKLQISDAERRSLDEQLKKSRQTITFETSNIPFETGVFAGSLSSSASAISSLGQPFTYYTHSMKAFEPTVCSRCGNKFFQFDALSTVAGDPKKCPTCRMKSL